MAHLLDPVRRPVSEALFDSFLAGWDEFVAECGTEEGASWAGVWNAAMVPLARPDATGAAVLAGLATLDDPQAERMSGFVLSTMYWWVDDDVWLGRINLRHRLNDALRTGHGGHLGYAVRPSARRRGHATAMLTAVLPLARVVGADPALVTCSEENVASRRVVEAVAATTGGRFAGHDDGARHYWV